MSNIVQFPNRDNSPVYSRTSNKLLPFENVVSLDRVRADRKCLEFMGVLGIDIKLVKSIYPGIDTEQKIDYTRYSTEDK